MNPATYRAIKAILETDPTIQDFYKKAILQVCEAPALEYRPAQIARPQFVTVKEAAEIFNTSKRTVWRLAKIGKLHRIKLGHRSTRFRLEDIANITSVDGSISKAD